MNFENTSRKVDKSYPEIGTSEVRKQIGKEIKSARDFHQLTLDDVKALTKINIVYLKNIEEGNWSFLPPTYTKAFIQSFSEAVKLSQEKIRPKLDELFAESITKLQIGKLQADPDEKPPVGKMNEILIWAERNRSMLFYGIMVLIVFVLIIIFLLPDKDEPNSYQSSYSPPADVETEELKSIDSLAVLNSDSIVKSEPTVEVETYQLRINALDTCYVKLTIEDSLIYEQTLWPGNTIRRKLSDPVTASFGNIHGVDIIIDGDTLGKFPQSRRVRRFTLDKDGIVRR